MSRVPARTAEQRLEDLYALLPAIECRGLCHHSCGPIGMTVPEQARIAAAGVNLPLLSLQPVACPALTVLKRCQVYEVRPLICRLWALVESMPCPHGCRPEGGLLPDEVGHEYLARAFDIGGEPERAQRIRAGLARRAAAEQSPARATVGRSLPIPPDLATRE